MDDLQLIKDIAVIEDIATLQGDGINRGDIYHIWQHSERYGILLQHKYNPLTDDAKCYRLMVKYKVLITWNPHINDNCTAVIDGTSDDIPFPFAIADFNDTNPNRAILLAIREANKDKL